MTYTAPTVNYSATINGTYTSLTGIQSVSINRGRQRFQDNFNQTSCVIELIPANSYALPLAVGQFIDVRDANTSTSPCYFSGVITDVSRRYQMPYNAGTGAAPDDQITITATGAVGGFGKVSVTGVSLIPDTVLTQITLAGDSQNILIYEILADTVATGTVNFTGGLLDLVNGLLRTNQYFIDDIDMQRQRISIGIYDYDLGVALFPPGVGNVQYTMSDAGTVGAFKFAALEYLSSVQTAFNKVEVVAEGLATQTATSGRAPFNTLVYNTYNASTSIALNLAEYIIATQNLASITPFSVTTNTLLSPTCTTIAKTANQAILGLPVADRAVNLGSALTMIFRGSTVQAQIQGINTTFYPEYASVQLHLSPSLGAQFILDNTTFGVLDQNKLGF